MKIEDLFSSNKSGGGSSDIVDIAPLIRLGARNAFLSDLGIYGEGHTRRLSLAVKIPLADERTIELSRSFFLNTRFLKASDKGDEQKAINRLVVTALGQLVAICAGTALEAQLRQIEAETPMEILQKSIDVIKAHIQSNRGGPIPVVAVITLNKRPDKAAEYPLDVVQILPAGSTNYSNTAKEAIQFIQMANLNAHRTL